MSVRTSTPAPWSRKRIRSSATGRMASGSSWMVTPSWRRLSGRLPSTWLAQWMRDSPKAPWETMRMPTMGPFYPVGAYAVKFVFTDGHDTGIYSWDYLYDLGAKKDSNWKSYLARLEQNNASRDVETPAAGQGGHVHGPGCSHH